MFFCSIRYYLSPAFLVPPTFPELQNLVIWSGIRAACCVHPLGKPTPSTAAALEIIVCTTRMHLVHGGPSISVYIEIYFYYLYIINCHLYKVWSVFLFVLIYGCNKSVTFSLIQSQFIPLPSLRRTTLWNLLVFIISGCTVQSWEVRSPITCSISATVMIIIVKINNIILTKANAFSPHIHVEGWDFFRINHVRIKKINQYL